MLHGQADSGDADPAAEAHKNWLAAGFNQFDDISVQTDGAHGQHNEKFAESFERIEGFYGYAHVQSNGGNNGSQYKVNNEKGKNAFNAVTAAIISVFCIFSG